MAKIVIAGASGFVGKNLIRYLSKEADHEIYALSRSEKKSNQNKKVQWVSCDLFSLLDIENALNGMDYAIYLVHSMLPTSRLTQGNFQDNDLILADNFARAAKKAAIKQVIYLGGIIPSDDKLSTHLQSRLETEETLKAYGTHVTALRAAIIIGREGSSFNIITKLVERLPALICPAWTQTLSRPVAIDDVVKAIAFCLGNEETYNKYYDLAGSDTGITYKQILEKTAQLMGLKRYFYNIRLFSPELSKLWVSTFSSTPKNLVSPLINSLQHNMLPDQEHELKIPNYRFSTFEDAMKGAIKSIPRNERSIPIFNKNYTYWRMAPRPNKVRSVQRLHRPIDKNAQWVAKQYMNWLPQFFKRIIKVQRHGNIFSFILLGHIELLQLTLFDNRSTPDRQLFYITGGALSHNDQGRGRIEFRETACGKYFICALHDYRPILPWYIYSYTQAPFHLFVMKKFQEYLSIVSGAALAQEKK